MVFRELLAMWHDETPLAELFKRFDEMMVIAKEMFERSTAPLTDSGKIESSHVQLAKMDSRLNTLQQVIRRDIVTHLSVQGVADVVPCLILMSLSKDVERIGDYCKNIDEIYRKAPHLLKDPLIPLLLEMRYNILCWFDKTKVAFDKKDKALARSTREEAYRTEKECDRQVWELAEDNKGRNAVAPAMLMRFFKRVSAHLGNICTSVTMPIDKLDYFDKPGGRKGELLEDE
ncbi:MAG: hypothetical protein JXA24_00940 [Proteobacteria bacterium]|nr:hypothetical protein [Pseudomonadota bacterium]